MRNTYKILQKAVDATNHNLIQRGFCFVMYLNRENGLYCFHSKPSNNHLHSGNMESSLAFIKGIALMWQTAQGLYNSKISGKPLCKEVEGLSGIQINNIVKELLNTP